MERHLQEQWAAGGGDAGEGAGDEVVEESADVAGAGVAAGVRVEDFEEVAESFLLGLAAELAVGVERGVVEGNVVVDGHGIEAEVCAEFSLVGFGVNLAALDLLDGGGAEGAG